jgi:hypothetical protein
MAAASIVVDLLMKTGSFETDTKRAEKALGNFQKTSINVAKTVVAGFTTAAVAIAASVRSQINAFDELSKSSQKIGVSVEALSGLKFAAEISGVSFDNLQVSLAKLSVNIDKFNTGTKSAVDTFNRLGIDPSQFATTEETLSALADRFAKLPDGATKTALAIEVFGKSGRDLIPLLNEGSAGIKTLTDDAARLGQVIDTEAAKAAVQFNDNLTKLKASATKLTITLTQELLPALVKITDQLLQIAKLNDIQSDNPIANFFSKSSFNTKNLDKQIAEQEQKLIDLRKTFDNLAPTKSFAMKLNDFVSGDRATLKLQIDIAEVELKRLIALSEEVNKIKISPTSTGSFEVPEADPAAEAAAKAREAATRRIESYIEALKKEAATLGFNAEQIKRYDASQLNLNATQRIAVDALIGKIEAYKEEERRLKDLDEALKEHERVLQSSAQLELDTLIETQQAQQNFADTIENYVNSVERAIDPSIELAENIGKLQAALSLGSIDEEQFNRLSEFIQKTYDKSQQVTDEITEFWIQAARNMQNAMSNLFFDVMQGRFGDLATSFKRTLDRMVSDLLASQFLKFLVGDFGRTGELGGFVGEIFASDEVKNLIRSNNESNKEIGRTIEQNADTFKANGRELNQGLGRTFSNFVSGLGSVVNTLISGFGSLLERLLSGLGNLLEKLLSGLGNLIERVLTGLGNFLESLLTGFGNFLNGLLTGLGNFANGLLSGFGSFLNGLLTGLGSFVNSLLAGLGRFTNEFLAGFGKAIEGIGTAVGQALSGVGNVLAGLRGVANQGVLGSALGGSGLADNVFGTIFGRYTGGPVSPNSPYLVGERGPELFVPSTSGRVIDANTTRSMGGGVTVQNNFTIQGTMDTRTQAQISSMVGMSVNRAMARNT